MGFTYSYSNIWKVENENKINYFVFASIRHGSPANLPKGQSQERVDFANFYLKGFSGIKLIDLFVWFYRIFLLAKVITLVFGILETYRQKIYVSPRVVQLCLNYLRER